MITATTLARCLDVVGSNDYRRLAVRAFVRDAACDRRQPVWIRRERRDDGRYRFHVEIYGTGYRLRTCSTPWQAKAYCDGNDLFCFSRELVDSRERRRWEAWLRFPQPVPIRVLVLGEVVAVRRAARIAVRAILGSATCGSYGTFALASRAIQSAPPDLIIAPDGLGEVRGQPLVDGLFAEGGDVALILMSVADEQPKRLADMAKSGRRVAFLAMRWTLADVQSALVSVGCAVDERCPKQT